jgi:hypothetical protein
VNPAASGTEYRACVDAVSPDDDLPSFCDPDKLDEPTPKLTDEQILALEMEELDLDPDDPDDRAEYERLRAIGAEAAAETPPELLAATGRMLEADQVAENEVAWWRFGRDPDEPVTEVPEHVATAVGRALVAAAELKAEAQRHPAYLRRLTVAHRLYRLGRFASRVRARARARSAAPERPQRPAQVAGTGRSRTRT